MKVIGIDGKIRTLKFSTTKRKSCSSYHLKVRLLLKDLFPSYTFYEEVTLCGTKTPYNDTLYADFMCPRLKLCIEVHGSQHYEFNSHFHKSIIEFNRGKNKDQTKIEFCELNNI